MIVGKYKLSLKPTCYLDVYHELAVYTSRTAILSTIGLGDGRLGQAGGVEVIFVSTSIDPVDNVEACALFDQSGRRVLVAFLPSQLSAAAAVAVEADRVACAYHDSILFPV